MFIGASVEAECNLNSTDNSLKTMKENTKRNGKSKSAQVRYSERLNFRKSQQEQIHSLDEKLESVPLRESEVCKRNGREGVNKFLSKKKPARADDYGKSSQHPQHSKKNGKKDNNNQRQLHRQLGRSNEDLALCCMMLAFSRK